MDGIQRLHEDEEGMEAIEIVMIIAVAAIVIYYLKHDLWPIIRRWIQTQVEQLTSGR